MNHSSFKKILNLAELCQRWVRKHLKSLQAIAWRNELSSGKSFTEYKAFDRDAEDKSFGGDISLKKLLNFRHSLLSPVLSFSCSFFPLLIYFGIVIESHCSVAFVWVSRVRLSSLIDINIKWMDRNEHRSIIYVRTETSA